ncbi:MAG: dolichyl-diphosphooligosaccharide--protein glycosyltransferase subunit 2 [Porphyromonadaceae bacterium]|nr:dolichyl-diphosphooligosaccharide--protein glycosyltransferase subunit 2 [Porphyromonadaceae bacterium]
MMKMTKYFLIFHTGMFLVAGFGMWFILKWLFPQTLVKGYPVIPIFFYLLGLVFIYVFNHNSPEKPGKVVNTYMLMRMIKIFISAVILLIYWIVDKINIRNFALIFVIFYIINLIWETYIYLRMEMYLKYKEDQKKPPRERID